MTTGKNKLAVAAAEKQQQQKETRSQKKKNVFTERVKEDWFPIFNGIFNSNLPDEWDLTLESETKKQSEKKREELWEWMMDETCRDVRFQCPDCRRTWHSAKGGVCFWLWRDEDNNNKGRCRGHIVVSISPQKCKACLKKNENAGWVGGQVPKDEIEALLQFLFMDIDYNIYGNQNYTEDDEAAIEKGRRKSHFYHMKKGPRPPHFKEGCKRCADGTCGTGRVKINKKKIGSKKK